MLPFEYEYIDNIRVRFGEALKPLWDADDLARLANLREQTGNDGYDRPGTSRVHVCDFMSGIRLIVSRETSKDDGLYLHVSASYSVKGTARLKTPAQFKSLVRTTLRELQIDASRAVSEVLTNNVLHLIFDADYCKQVCEQYGVRGEAAEAQSG